MPDSHFTSAILQWYAANGRDLPWRRTRDPYAIWLSEIILQQTRIAQGQAYWERFMARFPDVESLAAASEDEVLRLWEGLGYYSRGRNLLAAARQIATAGAFPSTLEGIRNLKGVGDYTAAAIGSIAFGLPAAVVDGNVYRVLSRYYGIDTPVGSTAAKKEFTALAQSLLPADRPGDFNHNAHLLRRPVSPAPWPTPAWHCGKAAWSRCRCGSALRPCRRGNWSMSICAARAARPSAAAEPATSGKASGSR